MYLIGEFIFELILRVLFESLFNFLFKTLLEGIINAVEKSYRFFFPLPPKPLPKKRKIKFRDFQN